MLSWYVSLKKLFCNFLKRGLLYKKKKCYQGQQILSLNCRFLFRRELMGRNAISKSHKLHALRNLSAKSPGLPRHLKYHIPHLF